MVTFNEFIDSDKKRNIFDTRTKKHIKYVQRYALKIEKQFPSLVGVVKQTKHHDKSKFKEPEYTKYVEINWYYHNKHNGIDIPFDPDWNTATTHHVKNNSHHPEYHDQSAGEKSINSKDRDKPSGNIVDGTKMSDIDIAEMCSDWMAMAKELGTSPKKWADDNIGIRWYFLPQQTELIYTIINKIY